MQLLRLGAPGEERPAVRTDDGTLFALDSLTPEIDGKFFATGGLAEVREAVSQGTLEQIDDPGDGSGLRLGAPIAKPGAVLCIGQNYAAHAAESGDSPPKTPILFFKHPNTVVGPYDDVLIPRESVKTDWEVELGVVIGKQARYLASPDEALEYVAGYVVSNDVSERTFQIEHSAGQWSKGKCCETFNPLGPFLVPADEVEPQKLGLRSSVNGEVRQDSTTADMIFDVAFLIWHLSQYLVLDAGDLINTGTPQGVALSGRFPFLEAGDVMELEIDGLGKQRQQLVQA
ncbi:fumarylacetoacetate hydrolase family protein [Tenggerimyces flavus]|uniref:Fumarylacetoacetate hydrolase family protein n=1 Tax=Tenggerimyces flavus TaxID=1708749 RepID=A0ABV7Y2P2_9ACTN|nr:fumarylacetoacetate hydrolase family protein [Tenggerimyces flavus]MBM7790782.1 2-keto-4-pentenoate hydratase/2-oxohepta-3-ene-1,7-dioic acid hydratase in catechol pathway [Tenggerimyces flavus]